MDNLGGTLREYSEKGWIPTMFNIWREKIERLHIIRTGALHQSFESKFEDVANGHEILMTFMRYGIYQATGTGYGFKSGNGGDLKFMDKTYRHEHRLDVPRKVGKKWGGYYTSGKPRKRRDWYSKKLFRSVMVMKEAVARITGEVAAATLCEALSDIRNAVK